MIFISNAEGTIVKVVPSPIQQGTNEGNEIVLLAPFTGSVNLLCTLPNGTRLTGQTMEGIFDNSIDELTENRLHGWRILLSDAVTEYPGNLQIQFEVTVSNGDSKTSRPFKTDVSNVWIKPGVYKIPDGDNDTDRKLAAATAAAYAAEGYEDNARTYSDIAQDWATGTVPKRTLNGNVIRDENDNIITKDGSQAKNNAQYYAEQAGESAGAASGSAIRAGDSAEAASGSANAAQAWAVGNAEGTEQFNNNAKYYAEAASGSAIRAGESAGAASGSAAFAEAWAVGTVKGADVQGNSDAYPHKNNNAKHYATEAGNALSKITPMHEDTTNKYNQIVKLDKNIAANKTSAEKAAANAEEIYAKLTKIMTFRGPVTEKPTDLSNYQDGDVIAVTAAGTDAGKDAGKEFVLWEGNWIELGDTSAEHQSIAALQTTVEEHGNAIDEINAEIESNHKEIEYVNITENGWYRIAETELSVWNYNNLIQLILHHQKASRHSAAIFATSGNFTATPEIVPIIHTHYNYKTLEQVRIVYPSPTDYSNKCAYLDIKINNAPKSSGEIITVNLNVKLSTIINKGWNFYSTLVPVNESLETNYNAVYNSLENDITETTTLINKVNDSVTVLSNTKLDMVTNEEGLNKVYVAQKDGTQKMYEIESSATKGGTGVWRDGNRYAQIKTPKDATGDYIINADYLNKKLEDVSANVEAISEQELIDILG